MSAIAITTDRLGGALLVAVPMFAASNAKRFSLIETLKNPFGYVLASLLTGYYLLATAAFQLAPVAEVALLLSTPPLFVLALRRVRGDAPTLLELLAAGLAVAGIALILEPGLTVAAGFGNRRLLGDVLAICAAVLTGFYVYLYRHLVQNGRAPGPTSVTLMTFVLGERRSDRDLVRVSDNDLYGSI